MTLIWRILRALCGGDGADQQWLTVIDYLVAEAAACPSQEVHPR